jgi:hypothetical protein
VEFAATLPQGSYNALAREDGTSRRGYAQLKGLVLGHIGDLVNKLRG